MVTIVSAHALHPEQKKLSMAAAASSVMRQHSGWNQPPCEQEAPSQPTMKMPSVSSSVTFRQNASRNQKQSEFGKKSRLAEADELFFMNWELYLDLLPGRGRHVLFLVGLGVLFLKPLLGLGGVLDDGDARAPPGARRRGKRSDVRLLLARLLVAVPLLPLPFGRLLALGRPFAENHGASWRGRVHQRTHGGLVIICETVEALDHVVDIRRAGEPKGVHGGGGGQDNALRVVPAINGKGRAAIWMILPDSLSPESQAALLDGDPAVAARGPARPGVLGGECGGTCLLQHRRRGCTSSRLQLSGRGRVSDAVPFFAKKMREYVSERREGE